MGGANICRPNCRVSSNSRFYFRAIWKKQIYCERIELSSYRIIHLFLLKSWTTLTSLCNLVASVSCLASMPPSQLLSQAMDPAPAKDSFPGERVASYVLTVHRGHGAQCTHYMRIQHLSMEERRLQLQRHTEKPVETDPDKWSRGQV